MKRTALLLAVLLLLLAVPALPARAAGTEIPILMYHHLAETGPYNVYTLSPTDFRAQMLWLRDNGFTAVLPSELALIAAGELPMPQRPVVITFDDGYRSNYELAFPILRETGLRAGVAVVTGQTGGASWGMTWDQLREMRDSGLWEIGSHSADLHREAGEDRQRGVRRRAGETREDYLARVTGDLLHSAALLESELETPCAWLSYPFGQTDPWLDEYLAQTDLFPVTTVTAGAAADLANGTRSLPRLRMGQDEPPWKNAALLALLDEKTTARGVSVPASCGARSYALSAYNLAGANYVRLRDLALLLSGSEHGFDVRWDEVSRQVSILTGEYYPPTGGELSETAGDVLSAVPESVSVLLDGRETLLTAYRFHGSYYVNLRWLSRLLSFSVAWDEGTRTITVN